jgi:hypothetical protein
MRHALIPGFVNIPVGTDFNTLWKIEDLFGLKEPEIVTGIPFAISI